MNTTTLQFLSPLISVSPALLESYRLSHVEPISEQEISLQCSQSFLPNERSLQVNSSLKIQYMKLQGHKKTLILI